MSATTWDLTGRAASVEVVQAASESANTIFAIVLDSDSWYRFVVEGRTLYFQSNIDGTKTSASTAYNQYQHRFWRFRHESSSNLLFWETSSDGKQWTVRHAATAQLTMSSLSIELSAGTYRIAASPGTAIFDNFNVVTLN